ncbi:MAG: hypothetical protein A2Z72_04180 [Omnitrophica bacterium RBG_13_46_9]|nr:MAG: hypothetical protein A2Z72_04180 [Omnitrophica bacterium RBG_13_46_9]
MVAKLGDSDIHKILAGKYESVYKDKFYLAYQDYWNGLMVKFASENRNSYILDYGCGVGRTLGFLLKRYDNVYGIDLSSDMLKVAFQENKDAKIAVSDAQTICFKDQSFDTVICKSVLHHLAKPYKAVRELNRVLKKGGWLVVSEPCRDNLIWRRIGQLYVKASANFSDYHRVFHSEKLTGIIAQNGFEIQNISYFGLMAFPLCATAYLFPIMQIIPFNSFFTKIMIRIDEALMKVPLLKEFHWHIMIHSKKNLSMDVE